MSRTRSFDKTLFIIILILLGAGMFILGSASIGLVGRLNISPVDIVLRQVFYGIILGGAAFFAAFRIPYHIWKSAAPYLFLVGLVMMVLVLIPGVGAQFGGAKRWIQIGSFSFQPAELFKLIFIIYLSSWIASRKSEIKSIRFGLTPFLCMLAVVSALLLLQPDMGTLMIFLSVGISLFFIGGGKISHLAGAVLFISIVMSVFILTEPYRWERFQTLLNPEEDLSDSGYQLHQALIAIGSGGVTGKGFGQSIQKFQYLPEPVGDAIFAVAGEELGFIGSVGIIFLFLFLLWRATFLLFYVPDLFARLLGGGIVIMIVLQSFINIGSFIGVIPMTGIPLVFISQGGSSLIVMLAGAGMLLNVTRYAK